MKVIEIYKNIKEAQAIIQVYINLLQEYVDDKEIQREFVPEFWKVRMEEAESKLFIVLDELSKLDI